MARTRTKKTRARKNRAGVVPRATRKFKPGDVVRVFAKARGIVVGHGTVANDGERVEIVSLDEPLVDRHGVTHRNVTAPPEFLLYVGRWDPRTMSVVETD